MISAEINERLTQTGPGTPMGEMLRRYWHPVGAVAELEKEPVQPARLLGENLTLFRMRNADFGMANGGPSPEGDSALRNPQSTIRYGLVAERCAHRGLSLAYGIPQENGLRCAYHGWTYNVDGKVVDMPFEPACLPLKIKAYPVEELGGLLWAYMGPEPAPLLPRWELLVNDAYLRSINVRVLPCNWVQCMDNSMDPVHFEHLHGYYWDWYNRKHGISRPVRTARHLKIDFDVFEYGVYKRRLMEGESEDHDDWAVGHPIFFPNTLVQGVGTGFGYQIRVPIDDTNTLHVLYNGRPLKPEEEPQKEIPVVRDAVKYDEWGRVDAPHIVLQDEMAWIGQGPIRDRTQDHLATSDKGVMLYHNLLLQNIEKVQRGEDPMGTIRDPDLNYPFVQVRREGVSAKMIQSGFAPGQGDPVFGGGRTAR